MFNFQCSNKNQRALKLFSKVYFFVYKQIPLIELQWRSLSRFFSGLYSSSAINLAFIVQ
jgi:hypothetical protein